MWSRIPPWALILLFAIFASVLSAASNLVYAYLPELFPTDLRASGIGLAVAASRVGSAASTFLCPIIVAYYGAHASLAGCVGVLVLGVLICMRWAPETGGVRLGVLDHKTLYACWASDALTPVRSQLTATGRDNKRLTFAADSKPRKRCSPVSLVSMTGT
jgi:MFS family permease